MSKMLTTTPLYKYYKIGDRERITPEALELHKATLIADVEYAAHDLGLFDPKVGLMLGVLARALKEEDYDLLFSHFLTYLKKKGNQR